MPRKLHSKEIEAVSALSATGQYEHFIKRVADSEEVWGLAMEGGWCGARDPGGKECIPFWPHPAYADAMAVNEWSDGKSKLISLADFLTKWLPGMARDGRLAAVFATPRAGAVNVEPLRLKQDLEAEREQYE
jgi:hypothetical protein